jgi:hypothetical protein
MMERSIAVKAYRRFSRFLYPAARVRLDRSGNQVQNGGGAAFKIDRRMW